MYLASTGIMVTIPLADKDALTRFIKRQILTRCTRVIASIPNTAIIGDIKFRRSRSALVTLSLTDDGRKSSMNRILGQNGSDTTIGILTSCKN